MGTLIRQWLGRDPGIAPREAAIQMLDRLVGARISNSRSGALSSYAAPEKCALSPHKTCANLARVFIAQTAMASSKRIPSLPRLNLPRLVSNPGAFSGAPPASKELRGEAKVSAEEFLLRERFSARMSTRSCQMRVEQIRQNVA